MATTCVLLIDSRAAHDASLMGFDHPTHQQDNATYCERSSGGEGEGRWSEYVISCEGETVTLSGPEAVAIARAIIQDHETLKAAEVVK